MVRARTYWSDSVERGQPEIIQLIYNITGAKTITAKDANAALTTFDAIAAQTTIDNFLGTSSEFTIAKFDATAMGTDAFGGVVQLNGQATEVVYMDASIYSGTGGVTVAVQHVAGSASLTDSSLSTQVAVGTSGNVGFRIVSTGLDSITAGQMVITLAIRSK